MGEDAARPRGRGRGWVRAFGPPAVAVTLALAGAATLAGCKTAATKAPVRTVTVLGQGSTTTEPDTADIKLSVESKAEAADTALSKASGTANAVIKALTAAGARKSELKTGQVNVAATKRWSPERRESVVIGYGATVKVDVTTKDLPNVGKLIVAAVQAGATRVEGPTYRVDRGNEARSGAIAAAVEDARTRAEIMAKTAGARLGGVVTVSETAADEPQYGGYRSLGGDAALVRWGVAGVPPIVPGKEPLRVTVRVVWELK